MITREDVKKIVDERFWRKAERLQPFKIGKRGEVLNELSDLINSGQYSPGAPAIIMEYDKGNGIVRHIPVFNMMDYSVYYFCVKKLDPVLAKKRINNTYGGWSLGGRIREMEEEEEMTYSLSYELSFSYNPQAWAKYYGEFNSKLYRRLLEFKQKKHFVAVEFDLANYYDNIRLDILERKIRADSDFHETEILNLLFYFLNYRDRKLSNYNPHHVGLPQDAIGDCSRLLANYYIQDYDQFMYDLLKKYEGSYFRFADDQYIFCKEKDIRILLQTASRKLFEIGLNINQLKVKTWQLEELEKYRSFEIFDILASPKKEEIKIKLNEFAEKTFTISKPEDLKNRGYPLLKRLLSFNYNLLKPEYRAQLIGKTMNKDFIYTSKGYTLANLYRNLREEEKKDFLIFLKECSDKSTHNAFHYELIDFAERIKLPEVKEYYKQRISDLDSERKKIL